MGLTHQHLDEADRLVRGRIAVAAASAVVGLICAIGGLAWPAAPLLIAALVVATATLLATVATHHLELTARARVAVTALLLVGDTAVLVAGIVAGGRLDYGLFLAALLLASIAVHVRALARLALLSTERLQGDGVVEVAGIAEVATRAREAIGIVRARAESLKLAAEEAGLAELLGHDLEVLVHQAEECQRALRELDRATARLPASRRPPERRAAARPACPRESTPQRS